MGGTWLKSVTSRQKKNSMKYFCIIKEKIAYMECVIQSSFFYSFYLFPSILIYNVDSALVSDLNACIWISNVFLVHALEKWRLQIMKKKQGGSRKGRDNAWWLGGG